MKHFLSFFLLFFSFLAGASAQANHIVISFDHRAAGVPLKLNQTVFPIWNNKNVKITRAQFYISEMTVHNADNTLTPLLDQYLLVNANTPTAEYDLGAWPVDAITGMTLHLGVPEAVNHLDPTTYPAGHPLALQNPTMHWGWSGGYRFMAIEGKVDNNGDGVPETEFQFHNLFDALYRSLEITGVKSAENGVLHLSFAVDYVQLFKNLDMTGNLLQHGGAAPNIAMMDNAATPQFLSLQGTTATDDLDANSERVTASPNPFSDATEIVYDLPGGDNLQMLVFNSLGQQIRRIDGLPVKGSIRFEKTALPDGVYHYAFYENGRLLARKQFVIQN